jgi:hypothetical protein
MTKYKLVKDGVSIDFPDLEAVAQFKSANPEWANIEAVSYTEEAEPVVPIVPEQVTLWQLRAALALQGKEADVTNAILQMQEPNKTIAMRAWEYSNNVFRTDPMTLVIKSILGLNDQEADGVFLLAGSL